MHNKSAIHRVMGYITILNKHLVAIMSVSYNITIVVILIINAFTFSTFQVASVVSPVQFVFWHAILL